MKSSTCCLSALLASLLALALMPLAASANLPKGEDVVAVPAVPDGLAVHNLFQTNMVVQRDKPIRVWGWAAPGEAVTVRFAGQEGAATAAKDRSWEVTLPAQAAKSEPSKLVVQGKDSTITLENVVIGDVWVLGGQSNMEHPLSRVEHGDLEIASANVPNIRVLTVPQGSTQEALPGFERLQEWSGWWKRHFPKGDWDVSSPELVRELSAIGYVFARRLHAAAGVPIGVIDVSRGGTTVETWTPPEVLRAIDTPEVKGLIAEWDEKVAAFDPKADLAKRITNHKNWIERQQKAGKAIPADRQAPPTDLKAGPIADANHYGNCYGGMLAPISGFAVKGAIWHQGFNNAFRPNGHIMYRDIFPKMIAAWREAFLDPELPFGIISLCTAGAPQTLDNYLEKMVDEGIFIRAVQYQTYADLVAAGDQNLGFASSYDMRRSWYHPGMKVPVGERIARWALGAHYGMRIGWKPPMVNEVKAEDGRLLLMMADQAGVDKDETMEGFAIAGEDRLYQPAQAAYLEVGRDQRNRPQYDKKIIVLTSPHVAKPIHFRYAWGRNPMGNVITTSNRAPLATQRSDDWTITEMPILSEKFADADHKAKMNEARKLLRAADLERRLKNARALLAEHADAEQK